MYGMNECGRDARFLCTMSVLVVGLGRYEGIEILIAAVRK